LYHYSTSLKGADIFFVVQTESLSMVAKVFMILVAAFTFQER